MRARKPRGGVSTGLDQRDPGRDQRVRGLDQRDRVRDGVKVSGLFRSSIRVSGVAATAAHLGAMYGRLSVHSDSLALDQRIVGDQRFSLLTSAFTGAMDLVAVPDDLIVHAGSSPGCSWATSSGRGCLDGDPVLFQAEEPVTARVDGLAATSLLLDRSSLLRAARAVYADDTLELRFDGPHPIDSGAAAVWRSALRMAEAAEPSLESDLVRSSIFGLVAVATLESFRLIGDRRLRHETVAALLAAYRRAIAFADAYAAEPITVQDLAVAAAVSLHDLTRAFRANSPSGLTPRQHLLRVRLASAHRDLVAADPTHGATVQGIAARWGFADRGRFAREYRGVYGVTPRQTLQT